MKLQYPDNVCVLLASAGSTTKQRTHGAMLGGVLRVFCVCVAVPCVCVV